jgi:hypothetical protein
MTSRGGQNITALFDGESFASRVAKVIYNSNTVAAALETLRTRFPTFFPPLE